MLIRSYVVYDGIALNYTLLVHRDATQRNKYNDRRLFTNTSDELN